MKVLRPYQQAAIDATLNQLRQYDSAVVVLPTGLGKTVYASKLISQWERGNCLFLAHTRELIEQAADKLGAELGYRPGVEMNVQAVELDTLWQGGMTIVGSVQTMYGDRRLKKYSKHPFGLIVVDECHHATAATYKKVVGYFQALNPNLKVVGITATPNRADGTALGLMFESVAYQMSINDAVGDGWLVPVVQEYVVVDSLDFDGIKTKKNEFGEADFNQSQLEELLTQEETLHKMAVPTIEKVGDRPTLIFTATVRHAHELAAVLNRYKQDSAAAVDGGTEKERRKEIVRDFAAGKVQFLCNCAVLCLDAETEILTDRGFVGIDGMTSEHKVANWENGRIWFDHPKLIVRRNREPGERMVTLETPRRSVRVTEDHRMLFRIGEGSDFRIVNARDLVGKRGNLPVSGHALPFVVEPEQEGYEVTPSRIRANAYHLRKSGRYSPAEAKAEATRRAMKRAQMRYSSPANLTLPECELIGFWLGDGSANYPRSGGVEYTFCQAAACKKIGQRIEWLLGECCTSLMAGNGERYVRWSVSRGTRYDATDDAGLYRLEPYLKKSGTPLLWGLDERQFDYLIRGLWMADGDHNDETKPPPGIRIVGVNHDLFDLLQAVAVCRGYRASIRVERKPRKSHYKPLLTLSLTKQTEHRMTDHTLQFEDGWKAERVWCVTSHSGNIVTRRRGSVTVMGNTEGFDAPGCAAIVMGRPTKSLSLYTQMMGRGLRPLPGIVDGVPDAFDRKTGIFTSAKPNCLAEGTPVLTDAGLVPIERVTRAMKVWDGFEFVTHCGTILRGECEVVTYAGLTATPDHKVWTDEGWKEIGQCALQQIPIRVTGIGGQAVRETAGYQRGGSAAQGSRHADDRVRLWHAVDQESFERGETDGRLPQLREAASRAPLALGSLHLGEAAMYEPERLRLLPLRREGYSLSLRLAHGNGGLRSRESGAASRVANRPDQQRWALRARQPQILNGGRELLQHATGEVGESGRCLSEGAPGHHLLRVPLAEAHFPGLDLEADRIAARKIRVWDILNAGPRHRFTAGGLLVSNCLVLDFVGNSNHKLAGAYDVLGGNYDSETKELARREATRQRKDVGEVMEQAAALLAIERQWKEREHIRAGAVRYGAFEVNPFDADAPELAGSAYTGPTRGTATDSQVRLLVNLGVTQQTAERYSKRQAGAVIDSIAQTRCTTKQAGVLRKHGIDPAGIGMDRASRIIDAIASNGWTRPAELPE